MGESILGTGVVSGEERPELAAQHAISSPLLDSASIGGAQGVLVNITGGTDLTLMEVDEATSIIFEEAGPDANIIFGAVIDPALNDEIHVTVIATGFNRRPALDEARNRQTQTQRTESSHSPSLIDKENVPLHQQQMFGNEQVNTEKPRLLFDDSNPVLYGNDLEIPAFIRRQQD